MKRVLLLFGVLLLTVALALAGCSDDSNREDRPMNDQEEIPTVRPEEKPVLRLEDYDGLSGYGLVEKINVDMEKIAGPYENEDGQIEYNEEILTQSSMEVYDWAKKLSDAGIIETATYCEDSYTVAFFLNDGTTSLYTPKIAGMYSGSGDDFSVLSVVGTGAISNAMDTMWDQGGSVKSASHIYDEVDECTEHIRYDSGNTVAELRLLLGGLKNSKTRAIFWRGHGCLYNHPDGTQMLALIIGQRVSDRTEELYQDDRTSDDGTPSTLATAGNYYAVNTCFFDTYLNHVDGGLFFCGSCYGGADGGDMAELLLRRGFQAYCGATGSIQVSYSDKLMYSMAKSLTKTDDQGRYLTAEQALQEAQTEHGAQDFMGIKIIIGTKGEFRLVDGDRERIDNNGGRVVGYRGNTYYFRLTERNVSKTGVLGYFEQYNDVPKDLICRSAEGVERVLTSAPTSSSNLYLCGEKIFFRKNDNKWYSVALDGNGEKKETTDSIVGYLSEEKLLVLQDSDGEYYASDFAGNTQKDIQYNPGFLGVHQDIKYYYMRSESGDEVTFRFYGVSPDGVRNNLGSIRTEQDSGTFATVGAACLGSTGIYVSIGSAGGSGMFYNEGVIYYIPFASGEITVVASGMNYDDMYLVRDGAGEYLYYSADSYMGASDYEASVPQGVKRVDLATGEITDSDFPLCDPDTPFIHDGQLLVLTQQQSTPTVILSKQMLSVMGHDALGSFDDGTVICHEWAQLVDGTYYVLITKKVPDDSSSIGWRQGYRRESSALYSIHLETGTLNCVFAY